MQLAQVYRYCDQVLAGEIPACRYHHRAVERFYHDLEHGPGRGLEFDEQQAQQILSFFPEALCHYEGAWHGKPFDLEPFQGFILAQVFGWKRADGTRRFRTVYEEEARKNGKTAKIAGTGLYLLCCDGEHGAQIYSAATKREQANISHRAARHMARSSPEFAGALQITPRVEGPRANTGSIYYSDLDAFWKTLGRDSHTEDGLNVHAALIDEYHAHKDRGIAGILETAMSARRQPLAWYITTAGFDSSGPCFELRGFVIDLLEGFDRDDGVKDDAVFGIVFTLDGYDREGDAKDDPWDEANWYKANPGLGSIKNLENLRDQARKARHSPSVLNEFLTKELNIWTQQAVAWCPMLHWRATPAKLVTLDELQGREVWAGLDLASVNDMCSLVLLSPSIHIAGGLDLFVRFYLPQAAIDNCRENASASPLYPRWAEQGWITVTPGNVTDYDFIERDILGANVAGKWQKGIAERVMLEGLAFDRYNSSQLVVHLVDAGIKCEGFGQGYQSMSAPMKEVERLILGHVLNHGNNPVLTWQAGNVRATRNAAEDVKPDKDASGKKIDGIVATIMAAGLWQRDGGASRVHDGKLMVV